MLEGTIIISEHIVKGKKVSQTLYLSIPATIVADSQFKLKKGKNRIRYDPEKNELIISSL